jgi:outer membrane protein assembly factor BamB
MAVSMPKNGGRWVLIFGIVIALFIVGVTIIPIILAVVFTQRAVSSANNAAQSFMTAMPAVAAQATNAPTKVPTLAPSPTPAYAQAVMHFGTNGIGPGMLNDARYLAIDGNSIIYVADYQGGRIQAFDETGKYLSQWKMGDSNTIIEGLSANQKGDVFVSADGFIYEYEGATGKFLMKLADPNGGEYGDLNSTSDGNLAGVWYQGRWGMITSLEGHRDDLVIYNPLAKITLRLPSFISGQTGDLALDTNLAIDGLGNIYALSDSVIYKFSPAGKYINRFGSSGDQPGQFSSPTSIAVDGQGRIFVGDTEVIDIFTPDGRFVTSFPAQAPADKMAFDQKGALWVVSRDKVIKYVIGEQ